MDSPELLQDAQQLPDVGKHGRAVVADRCRARGEVAIHDVEEDPRGAGELHDDVARAERVMQRRDLQQVEDQAVLVHDALRRTGRAARVADDERVVERDAGVDDAVV